MKKTLALIANAALLLTMGLGHASAAPNSASGLPVGTVRTIQVNAVAARENAAIYQWRRVDLETLRITAAEHNLEQAFPSGTAPAPAAALRQAVLDLRSAHAAHDSDRAQAAAQQISVQCALLLR